MDKSSNTFYRPVASWIFVGVAMLFIQVILGGITRLTGSGLSITEWNVVTGVLPPLNAEQWLAEFHKYQLTPQYQLLNTEFTLPDFKFIFFWEWFHRLWARLIAVAFAVPFLIFLLQKRFTGNMIRPLLILFLLGALQGAIGWIMVASGLNGDAVYVKPTRLALHFIFALVLIAYACWFAFQLSVPSREKWANDSLRRWTWAILALLFFQLIYGALMAGHKAATAAPTWPSINGMLVPDTLFRDMPAAINLIENKITIHFIHRMLAYLLLMATAIWTAKAYRIFIPTRYFNRSRWIPALLITVQVLLGISSVLTSTRIIPGKWGLFEWIAQFHQITGMAFLITLIWMLYLIRPSKVHA